MISLVAMVGLANSSAIQKKQVTLTAILAAPKDRWDILLTGAVQKLKERHPNMDIKVDYKVLPYNVSRGQMIMALNNQTPIDLISVDQIWQGDFAQRGYLTNLTGFVKSWGRASDWYQTNLDGGVYNGKVYGIWAWTDVRGMWYWKDLLSNAGVDPNSLQTWDGYISSLKKINSAYKEQGIKGGFALCGATEWYPYLWMLGGNILIMKDGHPTKGTYWFPTYNSSAGVKAAQFLKSEIAAGTKPILSNISGFERFYR